MTRPIGIEYSNQWGRLEYNSNLFKKRSVVSNIMRVPQGLSSNYPAGMTIIHLKKCKLLLAPNEGCQHIVDVSGFLYG